MNQALAKISLDMAATKIDEVKFTKNVEKNVLHGSRLQGACVDIITDHLKDTANIVNMVEKAVESTVQSILENL